MSASNIVTLALNKKDLKHDSTYVNHSYGCDQLEEVLVKVEYEGGTNTASLFKHVFVGVSVGVDSIVSRVPLAYLAELNQATDGTGAVVASAGSAGKIITSIPTGTWMLDKGSEVNVSLSYDYNAHVADGDTGTAANVELKYSIFACVNGITTPSPQRVFYKTDTAWTQDLVTELYACNLASAGFEDSEDEVTLQYGAESVQVPVQGANLKMNADSVGDAEITDLAQLYDSIPRSVTVNTTADDVSFLGIAKEIVSNDAIRKARVFIPNRFKGLNRKERLALAQGH